jgi:hypothetical protein
MVLFAREEAIAKSLATFFTSSRGRVTVIDQKGIELAGIEAARKEIVRRRRKLAEQDALQGVISGPRAAIVVTNGEWLPIFEVVMESDEA